MLFGFRFLAINTGQIIAGKTRPKLINEILIELAPSNNVHDSPFYQTVQEACLGCFVAIINVWGLTVHFLLGQMSIAQVVKHSVCLQPPS